MPFHIIKGHSHATAQLTRMMERGTVPPVLLFTGLKGIGKSTTARVLLKTFLCSQSETNACGTCSRCRQFDAGTHPDYLALTPDEKGRIAIGSSDRPDAGTVRWVLDRLSRRPVHGRYAVLIDGLDAISVAGQNALLKTLEEPPPHSHIVMTASHRGKILGTILSRSREMAFLPLSIEETGTLLSEQGKEDSGNLAALLSGGSLHYATLLCDDTIRQNVLKAHQAIFNYVAQGASLSQDDLSLFKSVSTEEALTLLLNLSSLLLRRRRSSVEYDKTLDVPEEIGAKEIHAVMKILLALKKGDTYNLDSMLQLPSQLYRYFETGSKSSAGITHGYPGY